MWIKEDKGASRIYYLIAIKQCSQCLINRILSREAFVELNENGWRSVQIYNNSLCITTTGLDLDIIEGK